MAFWDGIEVEYANLNQQSSWTSFFKVSSRRLVNFRREILALLAHCCVDPKFQVDQRKRESHVHVEQLYNRSRHTSTQRQIQSILQHSTM